MSNDGKQRDVSAIMRSVKSERTKPEMALRRYLWNKGLRYRVAPRYLTGRPDLVFTKRRVAVFVDGDFWHGHQWIKRGHASLEEQFAEAVTKSYWIDKIRRNMLRDAKVTSALTSQGWSVIRFWESHLLGNLETCANMVVEMVRDQPETALQAYLSDKTVAEFFAGIGLMRMGLESQGWSVVWANDIDHLKHRMYKGHFGIHEAALTDDDVHTVTSDTVPFVTLATASFPCTDLSLAGGRAGLNGKASSALWGFTRVIDDMGELRPPLVMLENVPGFLTSHNGIDFEQAMLELNRLGYAVDAFIVDAAWFVPQSRQRLFVIGVLSDLGYNLPHLATPVESRLRPKSLKQFIDSHTNIQWRVRTLPEPPEGGARLESILDDLPPDAPEWWSHERAEYLINQMSPKHRNIAQGMISADRYTYGTVFRRVRNSRSMAELRTDGIAGCLRTPKGGSGRQILFKAGNGRYFARLITPRECARLMGADDYTISVPLNQALFGFGDAVCVSAVAWIAEHYLDPVVNELIRGVPMRKGVTPR